MAVASPTPVLALSLKAAVQRALDDHPRIAAAIERRRASEHRLEQANALIGPSVDLNADVGKQFVDKPESLSAQNNARWWLRRQAAVSASLVLFDGWSRANAIYRDAAQVDARSREVIENAELLALEVIEAYIDHRRHHFLLAISDQNIADHEEILRLTRVRAEGGAATPSEVDQVLQRLYAAQSVRADILKATLEADAKFKSAVGIAPANTKRVGFPINMPRSVTGAVSLAIERNSGIQARQAAADSLDFELQRSRSSTLPTLTLEGSAEFANDINAVPGRNNDYTVKLELNFPLFDGGLRNAEIAESSAMAAEAWLQRDLKVRQVREQVEIVWGRLVASAEQMAALERQVGTAQSVAVAFKEEVDASKRSLLELLDAQNAVFSSRFESASVSGVRLFSAYHLKALTGTLLSSLGVTPPGGEVSDLRMLVPTGDNPLMHLKIEPLR